MPALNSVFFDIGNTLVADHSWIDGAKETLQQFNASGVRLGLISNTGDLSRAQLTNLLPNDFSFSVFEDSLILLSSEVGIEKPDLRIFLSAIQKAGVSPWECLFVGENLNETLAAQSAGMRSVRIVRVPEDLETLLKIGK